MDEHSLRQLKGKRADWFLQLWLLSCRKAPLGTLVQQLVITVGIGLRQ